MKFYASVRLDIRRGTAIKDQEEVLGNETRVKVVKNKVAPPFKTADFEIIYGEGVSRIGEVIDIATKNDIIEKSGSWYAYKGNKIGQGKENVKTYLKENPKVAEEIESLVREKLGIAKKKKSGEKSSEKNSEEKERKTKVVS